MKSIARNIVYSGAIRMKISRLKYTRDAKEKEKKPRIKKKIKGKSGIKTTERAS